MNCFANFTFSLILFTALFGDKKLGNKTETNIKYTRLENTKKFKKNFVGGGGGF